MKLKKNICVGFDRKMFSVTKKILWRH